MAKKIQIDKEIRDLFSKYNDKIEQVKESQYNTLNIFKILHQETYENKHSIFLSWLFNPTASHGLKNDFAQKFFDEVFGKNTINLKKSKIKHIYTEKRIDGEEQRIQNIDKKRIDILIVGSDFTCTIENKYGSGVHDGQCQAYRGYIEKEYKQFGENNKFVFLDIIKPNDFEEKHETNYANYDFIKYETIIEILNEIEKEKTEGFWKEKVRQKAYIDDYIEILEERYDSKKFDKSTIKICESMDLKDVLKLYNISDEQYEILSFDERIFVDTVRVYYQNQKKNIDNKIKECLESICSDKFFFKNDYGQKKEMYAYTIPVSIEILDKAIPDYLFNTKKISEKEKNEYKEIITKQLSDIKLTSEDRKKKTIYSKLIKQIKEDKKEKKTWNKNDIPFQTVDYRAPNEECENISIIIYAGLKPSYSEYICKNIDKEQAESLFKLSDNWKKKIIFYVTNGTGFKNGSVAKTLNITSAQELLDFLAIGKGFFGKKQSVDDVMKQLSSDDSQLLKMNKYFEKTDELIESFLKSNLTTKECYLCCEIELKYEIKEEDWNEEKLQRVFYDKTIEGTKVFNYDTWFKEIIFKT